MDYTVEDMRYCLEMAKRLAGGDLRNVEEHPDAIAWWNVYCRIGNHYQIGGKKYRLIKKTKKNELTK
jgi:hypothetical protein